MYFQLPRLPRNRRFIEIIASLAPSLALVGDLTLTTQHMSQSLTIYLKNNSTLYWTWGYLL